MGWRNCCQSIRSAYNVDGKGLSLADAIPGGKERLAILSSEEFDWSLYYNKHM